MFSSRFKTVVLGLLGALLLIRSAQLVGSSAPLRAHGERLWYGWAWRDPKMIETLRRIEPNLRPGEIVHLIGPDDVEPFWLSVMAHYFWPRQTLAGVGHDLPGGRRPHHLTVVRISGG